MRREIRLRRRPHPAARSRIKRQNSLPPFRLQRVLRNVRQLPKLARGTRPRKKTAGRGHGWPCRREESGGDRNRTNAVSFGKTGGRVQVRRRMRRIFGRPHRVARPRGGPRGGCESARRRAGRGARAGDRRHDQSDRLDSGTVEQGKWRVALLHSAVHRWACGCRNRSSWPTTCSRTNSCTRCCASVHTSSPNGASLSSKTPSIPSHRKPIAGVFGPQFLS